MCKTCITQYQFRYVQLTVTSHNLTVTCRIIGIFSLYVDSLMFFQQVDTGTSTITTTFYGTHQGQVNEWFSWAPACLEMRVSGESSSVINFSSLGHMLHAKIRIFQIFQIQASP